MVSGPITRPPSLAQGILKACHYYFTAGSNASSTGTTGTGTLRLLPWYVPTAVSLTRLGAEVTTVGEAGSLYRLGIYSDNGSGYPVALLVDADTILGRSVNR
jgi:hypothetical protein